MRTEAKRSTFSRRYRWNKAAPLRLMFEFVLRVLYQTIVRFELRNIERLPGSGGIIVFMNHISWADPFLLMGSLRRKVTPLAKVESFEDWRIGWMASTYGAIPVHRGAVDLQAIKAASEVLNGGGIVLIAPEGTRSKSGALIHAQDGLAFLASRTDAWLVPAAIVGSQDILPALKHLRRAHVSVTLGEAFKLDTGNRKLAREDLQRLTDEAMSHLAALLPEEMRGVYASPGSEVPSPGSTVPSPESRASPTGSAAPPSTSGLGTDDSGLKNA